MNHIPDLWITSHGYLHRDRLRREAAAQACSHPIPVSAGEISERLGRLRSKLREKLRISETAHPLEYHVHGRIACAGYHILRVSFLSEPGIRVTGNLYIPDGEGAFPAVLNLHGHKLEGKIAPGVQARGHILAQSGIVTLSVDAAGAGERGETERQWEYHGAMKAAELFLGGDSLMGQQVRDNRRALDVLQSLPFVDPERIGVTGASGGGNQTMWLSAMDDRVKAAVIVVSVGSFEAYVGERNCMCETLPGGLGMAEEWEVLGLIAPHPLLIINALHDTPSFSYQPMSGTCRQVEEIYGLLDARERLDWRLIDMTHGYHKGPMQAMLGWMRQWLAEAPGDSPAKLPEWEAVTPEELLCYALGEWPEECRYQALRTVRCRPETAFQDPDKAQRELARLVGWEQPISGGRWLGRRIRPDGTQLGLVFTHRELPLPVVLKADWKAAKSEVRLILSPLGKGSAFVTAQWKAVNEDGILAVTADLPGVGELAWEEGDILGVRLHDTARACLWLGYTLVGEWAEAIATMCRAIQAEAPLARIHVVAEQEAVFAALLCRALQPGLEFALTEFGCPKSAGSPGNASIAWCVPGFLPWGDMARLRQLGANREAVE